MLEIGSANWIIFSTSVLGAMLCAWTFLKYMGLWSTGQVVTRCLFSIAATFVVAMTLFYIFRDHDHFRAALIGMAITTLLGVLTNRSYGGSWFRA